MAAMVLDMSDQLIVDNSQRTHRFVCTLPPFLQYLVSERCELQTTEPYESGFVWHEMNEWESCVWACVCLSSAAYAMTRSLGEFEHKE